MTHVMHTRRFVEMNKTKMQARVGTRYTGVKTAVKTDYKSGVSSLKVKRGFSWNSRLQHLITLKVANSSCLKRKERVVLEQQTKMPHHTKVANNRQDGGHADTCYDKWLVKVFPEVDKTPQTL